jgi:hypothetical protein
MFVCVLRTRVCSHDQPIANGPKEAERQTETASERAGGEEVGMPPAHCTPGTASRGELSGSPGRAESRH